MNGTKPSRALKKNEFENREQSLQKILTKYQNGKMLGKNYQKTAHWNVEGTNAAVVRVENLV